LAVLVELANTKAARYDELQKVATLTDEEPEVALEQALMCLANVAQSKRHVPKIATNIMSAVHTAITSSASRLRTAAASLAVNMFVVGAKVWDLFLRFECLSGLKEMFRLAKEQEALLALKLIDFIADNERFMIQVRTVVGMEPIMFWSLSPNTELATVASSILTKSKHKILQGIPTFDPHANLTWGRAAHLLQHSKLVSGFDPVGVKVGTVRTGQMDALKWAADTQGTSYPYMMNYPVSNPPSST